MTLTLSELVQKYPNLERLVDVKVPIVGILAEKIMPLQRILDLDVGSVVVFAKHNTDPIKLMVNNVAIGAGKTIKVGDHFGLHIRNYSQQAVVDALRAR